MGQAGKDRRDLRGDLDHLLEVVEQEQHLPFSDVLGEAVRRPDGLGDRRRHERGVAERGETDPEGPCLVGGDERCRGFERKARLARSARARERDEARSLLDEREHLGELCRAADERARRPGQVRIRDRLEGREAPRPELEDCDCSLDVLETMLTEIGERVAVEKRSGRLRQHDLALRGRRLRPAQPGERRLLRSPRRLRAACPCVGRCVGGSDPRRAPRSLPVPRLLRRAPREKRRRTRLLVCRPRRRPQKRMRCARCPGVGRAHRRRPRHRVSEGGSSSPRRR